MSVSRQANRTSTLCFWDNIGQNIQQVFARQAIPMTWDFAESNPLGSASGCFSHQVSYLSNVVALSPTTQPGEIYFGMAQNGAMLEISDVVVSTDPPYYDNIGYADLSDFFYVWLRKALRTIWPHLFRRVLTPKEEELVATPYRHGGQEQAAEFFMAGMSRALENMARIARVDSATALFYAFKQSEVAKEGLISKGWATFLQAVAHSGFSMDGTWPIRTELIGNLKNKVNALASSIVLVCTKRPATAAVTTRREFIARLKREMPDALQTIKEAGVGPVDMAQSALGPGMGIFTSYAKVLEPDDAEMSVRAAIALINEVREEILGEEDAGYDAETRFCLDWFQTFGMHNGRSGDAISMANAYNLGLLDLEHAGVFLAKGGVARILKRTEMPDDWHPNMDNRLTHWECAQHLIRVLEAEDGGAEAAARLIANMRPEDAEAARALAYRLYDICEKKGWVQEAQAYNLLAQEFPHLEQTALEYEGQSGPAQKAFES
jgi:putative DNA methylase